MKSPHKLEQIANSFGTTNDVEKRMKLATEVREQMEYIIGHEYQNFLNYLFPVFYNFLREGKTEFRDGPENRLRNTILEIIARLPNTESLRPNVGNLLKLVMYLLEIENEENALICLRIIIDLHKNYRNKNMPLEREVDQFLKIVQTIYSDLPKTILDTFTNTPATQNNTSYESSKASPCIRSLQSFKVLTESPIIVVLLFQLYPPCLAQNIPKFMPLIIRTLSLTAPDGSYARHRVAYIDFIASQVKTLSFLAYLLRGHSDHVEPYQDNIPKYAIQLLLNCPRESAAIRKELLIATRHILATSFRAGFFSHIDTLLDENVLIGTGRTAHDTLRPLAYSTLVDLVHHVRGDLSLEQISKIVFLYSRNIHDSSLQFSIQTMSSKLLLNLVETIFKKNNPEINDGRAILIRILDAFVSKFSSLKKQIPKLLKENEQVKDCRTLVSTLVIGLKNIVWGITGCSKPCSTSSSVSNTTSNMMITEQTSTSNQQATLLQNSKSIYISLEESLIFSRLLKNALQCFIIFSNGQNNSFTQEEKDNLESFAQLFTMLDSRIFQDIFRMYLPLLFDHIVKNTAMLVIPQHFLVSPTVSRTFLEILLSFLMNRMEQLIGTEKDKNSFILTRLFKFAFSSVAISDNEMALKPHLTTIINSCISYGSEYKESANYFGLLRYLFRAVAKGKFDCLYQEFLPLLPDLLRWLNKLLVSSYDSIMKDTFSELCLTVPVRLPALTPFLDLLMHPLIWALHSSNTDLVFQGLSTFNSLINNLSADFIDTIPLDIRQKLINSVKLHIQSVDSSKSMQALQILGKLAGSNRKFLFDDTLPSYPASSFSQPPHPSHDIYNLYLWDWTGTDVTDCCLLDGFIINITLKPDHNISLSLGKSIYFAYKQLLITPSSDFEKIQQQKASTFLLTCLRVFLKEILPENKLLYEIMDKKNNPQNINIGNIPPHYYHINREILKTLLSSIIIIHSNPELSNMDITNTIFIDLCRHFSLLYIRNNTYEFATTFLSPLVFIDAIVELITSVNEIYIKASNEAISKLFEFSSILTDNNNTNNHHEISNPSNNPSNNMDDDISPNNSNNNNHDFQWCKYLLEQLINQCYEFEWYRKSGACQSLLLVIKLLNTNSTNTLLMKQLIPLTQGLLYAIKNSSQEIILQRNKVAIEALKVLISTAVNIYYDNQLIYENIFTHLVKILMNELSSSNKIIRELVKDSFKNIIKSHSDTFSLSNLLESLSDSVFTKLFAKNLNDLPIEHQIGNIDAVTYFLQLTPPILTFRPELVKLLKEALIIIEAGEPGKFQNPQTTHPQLKHLYDTQQLRESTRLEIELKRACIYLLSAAMSCESIKSSDYSDFRNQIIGIFFKTLTLKSSPVVEAAKKGLSQIISQHKLPKDLLQTSLRPILLYLADYRKLTTSLLQGLSRLLELLTNCFNVTLGDKLLEHLQNWEDPQNLKSWKEKEAIDIASSIIHIFHLLPPAASKFLEPLINLIISLEKILPRNISSPYRDNLILYLNNYPELAIDYFFVNINSQNHSKMFQLILQSPLAEKLRYNIANNPDKLLNTTLLLNNNDPNSNLVAYQGIQIIYTLLKFIPDWLLQNPNILQALLKIWISKGRYLRLIESSMKAPLYYLRETKLLVKCFLLYCKKQDNNDEIPILLHILDVFRCRTTVDYSFLKDYCKNDIVEKTNIEKKKTILLTYLQFSKDSSITTEHRVQILRILINPLLKKCFKRNEAQEIFNDKQLMKDVIQNILSCSVSVKPSGNLDDPQPSPQEEALSIELLCLATLLVQYIPSLLVDHRKDLLRFAWNQLKSEDATNKQCANVLVCRFIEAYDTPPRNVLQVFIALLHYYQVEARQLVRKALDILTPMLKIRIPEGDERFPTWIKYTKKILVEEGHTLPQLIHILQLLVRHPDLFYPCKGHFVQQIVTSLPRIGLLSSCPPENKKLTIDLVELIINWEKRRLKSHGLYDDSNDNNNNNNMIIDDKNNTLQSPNNEPIIEDDYKPTEGLVIVATNFLVRIVSMTENIRDGTNYIQRAQDLLREAFKIWPTVNVKLSYLENILDTSKQKSPMVLRGLQILEVILEHQLKQKMAGTLIDLHRVITPALESEDIGIVGRLSKILIEVVKAFPPTSNSRASVNFYKSISETIENGLQQQEKGKFFSSIIILKTICSGAPELLDQYLPSLIRLLQKLTKDHISPNSSSSKNIMQSDSNINTPIDSNSNNTTNNNTNNNTNNVSQPAETSDIILFCIRLIDSRISQQIEHKRSFFQSLLSIIEKSKNEKLLENITKMIRGWILGKDSKGNIINNIPPMTSKEKINFLLRMVRFEQFPELLALHKEFLDLVYYIYSDVNSTTKEKKNERTQLEPGFMMGLRSPDPEVRGKFFSIFHRSIEKTLSGRMNYILAIQNWESLGNHFWLKQALDLILALRKGKFDITWTQNSPKLPKLYNSSSDINSSNNNMDISLDNSSNINMDEDILSEDMCDLYQQHQNFIISLSNVKQKQLIDSLRDVMNVNEELSYHLWTNLFPTIWLVFDKSQQEKFFNAFILLIAKEYHHAQRDVYPNVIQALLEGLCHVPLATTTHNQAAFCQIMKFLGKTYNAWYFALHILEKEYFRLISIQQQNLSHISCDRIPYDFFSSISDLYSHLLENDYYFSTWHHFFAYSNEHLSHSAILANQFGQWQIALESYFHLLHKYMKQQTTIPPPIPIINNNNIPISNDSLSTDDNEAIFWQEQIIQCCKRLNQWDTLLDFGKTNNRADILIEAAWKLNTPDWVIMKELTLTKNPILPETSQFLIAQCYTLISEKKLSEIEHQISKIHCNLLEEWNSLPRMPSRAHIPILQQFQKLVELKESTKILEEMSSQQNLQPSIAEVKNTLLGWRERVPNTWEDITIWGDILSWRQYIFTKINAAYQSLPKMPNSTATYIGFHETAWSINMLSHIARKHGLIDVCINSLAKIYNLPNIEIQDAFVKLREQLKCYSTIPSLYSKGLDTINNTNLEYFTPPQKAEFFQLKGEFLSKLHYYKEANEAFASSVQLVDMIPQPTGWLSWGNFCDEQFEATNDLSWGECTLTCYSKAASFRSNAARRKLGRVLWLLCFKDTSNKCTLAQSFIQHTNSLPAWIWISWIPELLSSLYFSESNEIRIILERIVKEYPQALFYPLNCFIKQLQQHSSDDDPMQTDNNNNNDCEMSDSELPNNTKTKLLHKELALDNAQILMTSIKTLYPWLINDLNLLIQEIEISLSPKSEGFFINELSNILTICIEKYKEEPFDEIKNKLQLFLDSEEFSSMDSKLSEQFSDDFININNFKSLDNIISKLNEWISLFYGRFLALPLNISLGNLSLVLQQFENRSATPIEIPGYYNNDTEPRPDNHPYIERFLSTVEKQGPQSFSQYKISIQASNGSIKDFYISHNNNNNLSPEERFSKLITRFNYVCKKNHQMRSRVLTFNNPIRINISPQVQLLQSQDKFTSIQQTWTWTSSKLPPPYICIYNYYIEYLKKYKNISTDNNNNNDNLFMSDDNLNTSSFPPFDNNILLQNIQIYESLCKHVPSDILSKFVNSVVPSFRQLFSLRSQFAAQLGLSGMLGYIFCVNDRTLENISFSLNTGKIYHKNYYPSYNHSFILHQCHTIPFRLSRNFAEFINPLGISGPFTASMHGLCFALDQKQISLKEYIQLFLRDDIINKYINTPQDYLLLSSLDQLENIINENYKRITSLCNSNSPETITSKSDDVYQSIQTLLQAATSPHNIAQLPPSHHPWF